MLRPPGSFAASFVAGSLCLLAAGCELPAPSGTGPAGYPAPVPRVEVVSVERWTLGELEVPLASWDTVRLSASLEDLSYDEAAKGLPPQFWLGIPPIFPDPLHAGVTWADSIQIWQGDALNRRSLGLVRHSRVIGDTLIAGRQLLIVEERAGMRAPRVAHFELRTRETEVPREFIRHQRGIYQDLRARSWIDLEAGIYRARWDTLTTRPGLRSFDQTIGPRGDTVEVPARFDVIREFRVIELRP